MGQTCGYNRLHEGDWGVLGSARKGGDAAKHHRRYRGPDLGVMQDENSCAQLLCLHDNSFHLIGDVNRDVG
jgi:hypothetical protein